MLRLPRFEVAEPSSLEEAAALLHQHGDRARPMAGGTDLMPNMKHEIETPELVVGLWRIPGLAGIVEEPGRVRLGALNTLHGLSEDPLVRRWFPALADAAGLVAGPQLRRMGTLGGNVCLDTRCVFVNQTYFWRQALGFCLKKDGTVCHVVAGGRRCVAAASNDTAPVLMTLGASLRLVGPAGERELPIDQFYSTDGIFNQNRARDELLAEVIVPKPRPGTVMAYQKLRTRAAIDYPELGVAVLAELDPAQRVIRTDIAVTALGSRPIHVGKLDPACVGKPLDEATIAALAAIAHQRVKPLSNIATDPDYRRAMVPVFVKRAFRAALDRTAVAG
jgi:4-hydroxybenzoyl-CoA reductase subunit beta